MPKKVGKGKKIYTSINSYLYFEMLCLKDIYVHVLACSYFFYCNTAVVGTGYSEEQ